MLVRVEMYSAEQKVLRVKPSEVKMHDFSSVSVGTGVQLMPKHLNIFQFNCGNHSVRRSASASKHASRYMSLLDRHI